MSGRIFDHLEGAPLDEVRHFSRVARKMRSAPGWAPAYAERPLYVEPAPVSGEIEARR